MKWAFINNKGLFLTVLEPGMFVIKALPARFTASADGWECASRMEA